MKDQSKKVASLKHKEQVEKSRNARLMEEARKREDNLSENSQQVKVSRGCGLQGLHEACFEPGAHFLALICSFSALTSPNLTSSYSSSQGHSASEGGAHRGAGGGPEGECSNHC